MSGAFNGLAEIIRKRLGAKAIGFAASGRRTPKDEDYLKYSKSNDFIEYGFESEFVGRLPVVVSCQELGVDDLFEILKNSEGSIMRQYINAFDAYGIELTTTDDGLYRIAQKAYEEHTGARSLVGVCERTFREYKYSLPHSPVRGLELTAKLVDNPEEVLGQIIQTARARKLEEMDSALQSIAEEWSKQNGIQIHLQPEAARLLSQKALDSGAKLEEVFTSLFKDYEHGLNLIRTSPGDLQFEITPEVVKDPRTTLDQWIRAVYIGRK